MLFCESKVQFFWFFNYRVDCVINLMATAPAYTEKNQKIFLLHIAEIFTHLLIPVKSQSQISISMSPQLRSIIAVMISRLEKDSSVPVIISFLPLLQTLFQSDSGIIGFLNECRGRPVLNWILVGLAKDLKQDPTNSSTVVLSKMVKNTFLALNKKYSDSFSTRDVCVPMMKLRDLAGLVVAYIRHYNKEKPTYRIPLNRDPVMICCGDIDGLLPDCVAEFVSLVNEMVKEFADIDDPGGSYLVADARGAYHEVAENTTAEVKKGLIEQFTIAAPKFAGECGNAYGEWQTGQVSSLRACRWLEVVTVRSSPVPDVNRLKISSPRD